MAEIVVRTFADVLANRDLSSARVNSDINVKVKTGAVACLRLVDGPEGCNGVHCEKQENRCQEKECLERLQEKVSALKAANEAITANITQEHEDIDELVHEITVYCRTDSLYYPKMEESRLALEAAIAEETETATCECAECQIRFQQKDAKTLKHKTAATRTRLTALTEYRRANDKETLARTSSSYMNGGKQFTPVGAAKARGVKALRPT